jgi:hypothetical protein
MPLISASEKLVPWKREYIRQSKISLYLSFFIPNVGLMLFTKPTINSSFFLLDRFDKLTNVFNFPTKTFEEYVKKQKLNRRFKFLLMNTLLMIYLTKNYSIISDYEQKEVAKLNESVLE